MRYLVAPLLAALVLIASFAPSPQFLHAQIVNSESALVSWTPPTQNEDGSALTDLSHYYLYFDVDPVLPPAPMQFAHKVEVGGNLTAFLVEGLGPGTWCFAMTAVNSSSLESGFSNVACKTIDPLVPEPTRPKAPGGLAAQ